MKLIVVSPAGLLAEAECDTVRLPVSDGGSCGIRPGHAPELIALGAGRVTAARAGSPVLEREIGPGVASVTPDTVTVIVG